MTEFALEAEHIIPSTAKEGVSASATDQEVIGGTTIKVIVASTARQRVGTIVNGELVVGCAAVRLHRHALAYTLANLLRTLATPDGIDTWSLTSLRERLVKTGARLVRHARYAIFQLAPTGRSSVAARRVRRHPQPHQQPAGHTS